MKILICGPEGSGKTTLAKPFAELVGGVYVTGDTYQNELRGYVDGIVAAGKIVIIDKRCNSNSAKEYLDPDYLVWMDTIKETTEFQKPKKFNYHVATWFQDTHAQLADVVKSYLEKKEKALETTK